MIRKPKIKIPFAKRGYDLVHISEIPSGLHLDCRCVACDEALIAKKGGSGRAHHFAHRSASTCNPETALHHLGKVILADRIEQLVKAGAPFPMTWRCPLCEGVHSGNLLKRARHVVTETALESRIPDLTLLDENRQVCGVIEIIVSHEPEPEARDFYLTKKIPLVEILLEDGEDLLKLRDSTELQAARVSHCPIPRWQLRLVMFAGTLLKLGEVSIDLKGTELRIRATGDDPPQGTFWFDSSAQAEAALAALKDGSLDGLYDPEQLRGVVYPSDIIAQHLRLIKFGLNAYEWDFCGIGRSRWKRGRGRSRSI